MSASRIVLATIEAAAIDIEIPSPPTIGRAGQMSPSGVSRPSISARWGRRLKPATARAIALSAAPRMFIASISSTLANTIATLSALAKMISHKCSRLASGSALESSTPNGRSSGSRMTAATPTGPASGPRPTSSTPATHRWPQAKASRSKSKCGVAAAGSGGAANSFFIDLNAAPHESRRLVDLEAIAGPAGEPRWRIGNAGGNNHGIGQALVSE